MGDVLGIGDRIIRRVRGSSKPIEVASPDVMMAAGRFPLVGQGPRADRAADRFRMATEELGGRWYVQLCVQVPIGSSEEFLEERHSRCHRLPGPVLSQGLILQDRLPHKRVQPGGKSFRDLQVLEGEWKLH